MSDLSESNSDPFNSTLDIRTLSIRDVLGTGLKLSDSESENMLNKHCSIQTITKTKQRRNFLKIYMNEG